jgi:hypothetical protein
MDESSPKNLSIPKGCKIQYLRYQIKSFLRAALLRLIKGG